LHQGNLAQSAKGAKQGKSNVEKAGRKRNESTRQSRWANEFWLQSGGRLESDGNFTLPFEFTPRALTGIRPNKRSLYRHRYEMLAGISASIRQNMTRLAGAPHHSLAARNAP